MLLLGHAYRTPVMVTDAALARARRTLRHWRQLVADWAQEPSRPIPADLLRQAHAALADNLGVPAVLDMLRSVERDAGVPAGAKFETFAHLDRVLGLDLAREVGHQHQVTP
jgi:cysteinyl-tRNA synthetase